MTSSALAQLETKSILHGLQSEEQKEKIAQHAGVMLTSVIQAQVFRSFQNHSLYEQAEPSSGGTDR